MSNRLSKIYTRKGDDGTTSLDGKNRLSKTSTAIETLGTLDELNSFIGLVLALEPKHEEIHAELTQIQQDLFDIGGELCPPHHHVITAKKVTHLENILDKWNAPLPPLKEFILPGGNVTSATCHVARTVCRRAERCLFTLNRAEKINPETLHYMNRLSDVLFVIARVLAQETQSKEVMWEHERKK